MAGALRSTLQLPFEAPGRRDAPALHSVPLPEA